MSNLRKAIDSSLGKEIKEYLLSRLNELRSIENLGEKGTAEEQAIEVKAQKRAYLQLKTILSDIITFSEPEKNRDPRDNFGIVD